MAAPTEDDSMGSTARSLDSDQVHVAKCLEEFESCTKKPETFLEVQLEVAETMKRLTKDLYDVMDQWKGKTVSSSKTELPSLVVDNFDDEQIWQQLELRNTRLVKDLISSVSRVATKSSISFGVDLGKQESQQRPEKHYPGEIDKLDLADVAAEEEDDEDDDFDLSDASEGDEDSEEEADDDGADGSEQGQARDTQPSSIVDDAFFRLADMEAFADREEKVANAPGSDSDEDDDIDYFRELSSDEDDPEEKGGRNATYNDFFDPPASMPDSKNAKNADKAATRTNGHRDTNQNSTAKDDVQKSSFEQSQEFIKKKIKQFEERNLEPRPWRLQGEVEATARPENSLLQEHIQFDHATRQPVAITDETTKCLEDVILQRIRDKAWDDVERKTRPTEEPFELRRRVTLDQEKSKLSLAQVYEQQFLDKQKAADEDALPKENPAHVEIRTAMRDLFTKLDALSNFHMMPKPVSAEVKVVSNLPSLSVEEVTPVGVSDASLLAPQEVKTKPKGELVSKGERTRTQKMRERRLKKALQKRRAAKANNKAGKVTEEKRKVIKATNTELAKPVKGAKSAKGAKAVKGKSDKWAEKSLSSSKKFFERLQDQVTSAVAPAKKKMKKKDAVVAANFKL
ncbi:U3 small nucleolar ribonucleoprotein protein MPP10 [Rhipicephalus sanguineus]|uniref:U3 small nucleolar ribonucleoprotein protein MPP10 n=1 Tax=Rhipicephalus sanguineus TaxID=34632 RepID=UPI001895C9F6|nr:U3 small nucleolar ribonucleoprotein protein MPP10 [Rhipicephalus sanguineus]